MFFLKSMVAFLACAVFTNGSYELNENGINTPLWLGSVLLTSPVLGSALSDQAIVDKIILQWLDQTLAWLCPLVDLSIINHLTSTSEASINQLGHAKIGMMLKLKGSRNDFWWLESSVEEHKQGRETPSI